MKNVYFVRHGETESNMGGFYQSPDVELSQKGHEGARAVAERFKHINVDTVLSSPFTRARQTAEHIAEATQRPLGICDHAHEVLNASVMWGKHFDSEVGKTYEAEKAKNFNNPDWQPNGAENYYLVSQRVNRVIAQLEENEDSNIVLVSHGNFLRYLIARLMLAGKDDVETNTIIYKSLARMSNVAITFFEYDEAKWKLITWNDFAHFAE